MQVSEEFKVPKCSSLETLDDPDYWEYSKPCLYDFDDPDNSPSKYGFSKKSGLSDILSIEKINAQKKKLLLSDQAEIRLQNTLESVVKCSKANETSIDSVINSLMRGIDISLHQFKSREAKVNLLDRALESYDGNVITCVLIFLEKTLSWRIFIQELLSRPVAVDHYIEILRDTSRAKDLSDFLIMLRRCEDAAFISYNASMNINHIESKLNSLRHLEKNFFKDLDPIYEKGINQQISLYERQLPIQEDDKARLPEEQVQILSSCRLWPLVGCSLIDTLFYCVGVHYQLDENKFASPKSIDKKYKLLPVQYVYTALRSLAAFKNWNEIDQLFYSQSLFGTKKVKHIIPFQRVVKILAKSEAPVDLMKKYYQLIEDSGIKLELLQEIQTDL